MSKGKNGKSLRERPTAPTRNVTFGTGFTTEEVLRAIRWNQHCARMDEVQGKNKQAAEKEAADAALGLAAQIATVVKEVHAAGESENSQGTLPPGSRR